MQGCYGQVLLMCGLFSEITDACVTS